MQTNETLKAELLWSNVPAALETHRAQTSKPTAGWRLQQWEVSLERQGVVSFSVAMASGAF